MASVRDIGSRQEKIFNHEGQEVSRRNRKWPSR